MITPSIGIEQPGCVAWEPAFGQDLEWTLPARAVAARPRRTATSAYFRLSTRPIDQALHDAATREEVLRRRLPAARRRGRRGVVIAVMGALVPEAVAAADMLAEEAGVEAEVVCITSADLLFRSFQARAGLGDGDPAHARRACSRTRACRSSRCSTATRTRSRFLGASRRPIACLGVQRFGQSGDIAELYEHHQIDAESVVGAALDLMGP